MEVKTPEFVDYSKQVVANCRALAKVLIDGGEKLITDGTDNHLLMWDVRPHKLTGSKVEKLLEYANITVNKNSVVGDKSALTPGGIRIGTPALTTRGFREEEFEQVGQFLIRSIKIAVRIQDATGKKLVDFEKALKDDEEVKQLHDEVKALAVQFSIPGN